ncbi:MAG TPA: PspC domain-containing protein [Virgibacillus sp.]|nr:PspC domain-containing protein [Virgibacillus sp.]
MKRLYRSNKERMLAGILGGIAEYFRLDPTLLRLGFVAGMFISAGTLFFFYIIAIFIIPNEWEVR